MKKVQKVGTAPFGIRLACVAVFVMVQLALAADTNQFLSAMPRGYFLQAYDDCGVASRQPHVLMKDSYIWTFQTSDTTAPLKERSAVFGNDRVNAIYTNLDPALSYILALTYANDHVYHRVQNLEANDGILLHGPFTVPNGRATRVMVKVPAAAVRNGVLKLTWKRLDQANATVSVIELWANRPNKQALQFDSLVGAEDVLHGNVVDLAYDAVSNVRVKLSAAGGTEGLDAHTDKEGAFIFSRKAVETIAQGRPVTLTAQRADEESSTNIETTNLFFNPIRYRPIPVNVTGLKNCAVSLDGLWRIHPVPGQDLRGTPLDGADWKEFSVPGQWMEQGYDIPRDRTVAVAKEFVVPANWAGYRIFLRFDAIHGGTHYWLNGQPLGYSENLFTPVEWEITGAAKIGVTNRLDLEMVVATDSEALSKMSDYAEHSLGGIDRAVRIYALPKIHIATLHVNAGLDKNYRDGDLQLTLGLDNLDTSPRSGLVAGIRLIDARGKAIEHSVPSVEIEPLQHGLTSVQVESRVPHPLQWNAEQPNLYKLQITLSQSGKVIERIERNVGFRTVETRDRQLYVNGVRVKLAGVCHHEIDPLTGRANTMRHAEEDVKLYKNANLNFVRTSHYPCTQEFLDMADRYGLYIESESPFCWLAPTDNLNDLKTMLPPVSAMVDYNHSHPSVIMWSLANESHWSDDFKYCNRLVKELDPTRPTTIEHAFSREDEVTCDIISRHYQPMPYDNILPDDRRPFLHGECDFLVYHERTDVAIDPGLRELWACGNADPDSAWGRACLNNVKQAQGLTAGVYPGAWSYIYHSPHCIGSEIWSGVDDIALLPGGKIASSEHGNAYWGLIDGWRRPKPELALSKFVFAPVWFPKRQLDYKAGQEKVRIPVENRYSFTDLGQLAIAWELNGKKARAHLSLAPGAAGELDVPVPKGTAEGSTLLVRVLNGRNEIVNAALALGEKKSAALPQPHAGPPTWHDDGKMITIAGNGFSLALDRTKGDFDAVNQNHHAPILTFPKLHLTRHDFGDLDGRKPRFAEFPDAASRIIDSVLVSNVDGGLAVTIQDHYKNFAGRVRWVMDADGIGEISYDYTYTGPAMDTREIGIEALLAPQCDEVKWHRWSEWGDFPEDCICRAQGTAMAHRDKKWPRQAANVKPPWPWSQDETALGTADFRSIKFNIYQASMVAPNHTGMQVNANADAHFRCCLAKGGVNVYILKQCPLAPVTLNKGARLAGRFSIRLLQHGSQY